MVVLYLIAVLLALVAILFAFAAAVGMFFIYAAGWAVILVCNLFRRTP